MTDEEKAWYKATKTWCEQEHARLTAALATCEAQGVHEPWRLAYLDLGDFSMRCGAFHEAVTYYDKACEYSTTNEHMLSMYMNALEAAWHAHEPTRVLTYVDQAMIVLQMLERLWKGPADPDAWTKALQQGTGATTLPTSDVPTTTPGCAEMASLYVGAREASVASLPMIRARLEAFRFLAQWSLCSIYDEAWPDVYDASLWTAYSDVLAPQQGVWYTVIYALGCAPAAQRQRASHSLARPTFQANTAVVDTPRRILTAYVRSDFVTCWQLIQETAASAWAMDPVLGIERSQALVPILGRRLLACYLSAFERVSLSTLRATFGADVCAWLVDLASVCQGRIDWEAQVWAASTTARPPCEVLQHMQASQAMRERMVWAYQLSRQGVVVGRASATPITSSTAS